MSVTRLSEQVFRQNLPFKFNNIVFKHCDIIPFVNFLQFYCIIIDILLRPLIIPYLQVKTDRSDRLLFCKYIH